MKRRERGFTLLEVMIVAALIGLLSSLMTPVLSRIRADAEDRAMQAELNSIYRAIIVFHNMNGRYPKDYQELSRYVQVSNFEQKYQLNPNSPG